MYVLSKTMPRNVDSHLLNLCPAFHTCNGKPSIKAVHIKSLSFGGPPPRKWKTELASCWTLVRDLAIPVKPWDQHLTDTLWPYRIVSLVRTTAVWCYRFQNNYCIPLKWITGPYSTRSPTVPREFGGRRFSVQKLRYCFYTNPTSTARNGMRPGPAKKMSRLCRKGNRRFWRHSVR